MDVAKQQPRWDRHQLVSARAGSTARRLDLELEIAQWNLIQMAGDRRGVVREPVRVEISTDGKPHGFSGFGVSDSGGQQWASSRSAARVGRGREVVPPSLHELAYDDDRPSRPEAA